MNDQKVDRTLGISPVSVVVTMVMLVLVIVVVMVMGGGIMRFRTNTKRFPSKLLEQPIGAEKLIPARKSGLFEKNFLSQPTAGRKKGLFDIFPSSGFVLFGVSAPANEC